MSFNTLSLLWNWTEIFEDFCNVKDVIANEFLSLKSKIFWDSSNSKFPSFLLSFKRLRQRTLKHVTILNLANVLNFKLAMSILKQSSYSANCVNFISQGKWGREKASFHTITNASSCISMQREICYWQWCGMWARVEFDLFSSTFCSGTPRNSTLFDNFTYPSSPAFIFTRSCTTGCRRKKFRMFTFPSKFSTPLWVPFSLLKPSHFTHNKLPLLLDLTDELLFLLVQ